MGLWWLRRKRRRKGDGDGGVLGSVERVKRRRVVKRRSAQIESVDCALEIMRDFDDDDGGEKEEEEEGEFSLVVVVDDDLSCGNNTKRRLMLLLLLVVVVLLSSLVDFGFVIVERIVGDVSWL